MLMLGAELTYIDNRSNKFHTSLLVDRFVAVRFGRRSGYGSQDQMKQFPDAEKAQSYYWNLLRGKMGKGYHVVDAAVLPEPDRTKRLGSDWVDCDWWMDIWATTARTKRWPHRQRAITHPDLQERSPRTAKDGAAVIADLTRADCDPARLLECSIAHETERFLRPMALSHPNCPDEAYVAGYLTGLLT